MEPDSLPALSGFPIVITLPVQWGDQDAFLHVNNTVYLRWFESARIDYSRRIGLSDLMAAERIGPILASITCHYRRPIVFPETVHVGARITRIGRTSLTMEHAVVMASTGAISAEGHSVLVVFDYESNRPHPVPEPIRRAIESLEGKPL